MKASARSKAALDPAVFDAPDDNGNAAHLSVASADTLPVRSPAHDLHDELRLQFEGQEKRWPAYVRAAFIFGSAMGLWGAMFGLVAWTRAHL